MLRTIYISSNCTLRRGDNTIVLESDEGKQVVPVETVEEIKVFGEVDLNKRFLEFISQKGILIHFFNHYGYYVGTYYPRETLNSGLITLSQAEHYLDPEKRLYLAKAFVIGAIGNMLFNLRIYATRDRELSQQREAIGEAMGRINEPRDTEELMALEGNAREIYYTAFDEIITQEGFEFESRTRRPPRNQLNALISLGNSLMYTTALSEIYRTHLDPRIGYLHTPNQRSFSLNLDLAEIFKPLVVDRVIFALLNRQQIKPGDFSEEARGIYLKENPRKTFIKAYEERLAETVAHKNLGRQVSYRRMIRLECYKLYRHFIDEEDYVPYVRKE
ncbi:MAG: type I-B CRISPR-associated endonuclease Cas1b [candidate division WOR-3 bacterium]